MFGTTVITLSPQLRHSICLGWHKECSPGEHQADERHGHGPGRASRSQHMYTCPVLVHWSLVDPARLRQVHPTRPRAGPVSVLSLHTVLVSGTPRATKPSFHMAEY